MRTIDADALRSRIEGMLAVPLGYKGLPDLNGYAVLAEIDGAPTVNAPAVRRQSRQRDREHCGDPDAALAADTPVVRCRNCIHCIYVYPGYNLIYCNKPYEAGPRRADWFCADGR